MVSSLWVGVSSHLHWVEYLEYNNLCSSEILSILKFTSKLIFESLLEELPLCLGVLELAEITFHPRNSTSYLFMNTPLNTPFWVIVNIYTLDVIPCFCCLSISCLGMYYSGSNKIVSVSLVTIWLSQYWLSPQHCFFGLIVLWASLLIHTVKSQWDR